MAHFFAVLAGKEKLRTTIDDGLKALELAEAATTSWREGRIVTDGVTGVDLTAAAARRSR